MSMTTHIWLVLMIKWVAMNKVVVPMTTDVTGMMIAMVAMTVDVLGTKMMLTIWRKCFGTLHQRCYLGAQKV